MQRLRVTRVAFLFASFPLFLSACSGSRSPQSVDDGTPRQSPEPAAENLLLLSRRSARRGGALSERRSGLQQPWHARDTAPGAGRLRPHPGGELRLHGPAGNRLLLALSARGLGREDHGKG